MVTLPGSKSIETLEEEEEQEYSTVTEYIVEEIDQAEEETEPAEETEQAEEETEAAEEETGAAEEETEAADDIAIFVESRRGKTVLQYKGHRYRKAYKSKNGIRWNCSLNKNCSAFLFLNDNDEILMSNVDHEHPQPSRLENVDTDQTGKKLSTLNLRQGQTSDHNVDMSNNFQFNTNNIIEN